MTFLNAVLLGGLGAAAVPLLIHLFHRSRIRVVPWGAMHLLESVLRRNRRRIRLEQVILLLVRCSIPALLALCMARPVLLGSRSLLGEARTSTALLLDNSFSMEAGAPGRTRLEESRETAGRLLEALVPGSEISLIRMAGPASPADGLSTDLVRVGAELRRTRTVFAPARFPEALQAAGEQLAQAQHAHRDIVVLTDFQRVSWSQAETAARNRVREILQKGPLPPSLTFFHAGGAPTRNVSVDSPLVRSVMVLGVGQRLQVRANLRNHGDAEVPDLRVTFRVDGRERATSRVTLAPHEQGQVLFTHAFETAGSHLIEVAADPDLLPADNSCLASIPVWNRVPVLLVSGDPNPEPLLGETDFAEIALRPYASAKSDLVDLIQPRVIEARDLDAGALAETRVVLLANVAQLTDAQLQALTDFVREGGGLLVFPGNRINSAWYNGTLHAEGKGLLPCPMTSLAGTLGTTGTSASILPQHHEHPALEIFNDPRNGSLSEARIRLWYRLKDAPRSAAVVARLDTGDPFLAEKKYGEGRVIQSCVPCDADWSDLPMRTAYLPLLQQLVTYLASQGFPPRNVDVGGALVASLPASDAGKIAVLTDPGGQTHPLPVVMRGARAAVEFTRTSAPGLYVLDVPEGERVHFVVQPDSRESDIRTLTDPEIAALARGMGARLVRSWEEYRRFDQERRHGREIWPLLLLVVVALAFLEIILQRYFAGRGRNPKSQIPTGSPLEPPQGGQP